MPKYEFECESCSIRFQRTLTQAEYTTHPCPECHEEAPLLLSSFGFGFQNSKQGTAPANTGVHTNDYPTADRIVGKDSEAKWEYINGRTVVKEEIRETVKKRPLQRVDGKDENGVPYSEYVNMLDNQMDARRKMAKNMFEKLRQKKPQKTP